MEGRKKEREKKKKERKEERKEERRKENSEAFLNVVQWVKNPTAVAQFAGEALV